MSGSPTQKSDTEGQERRAFRRQFWTMLTGPARDPFAPETRRHITLIAFLAWVGLGADSLSSSAYGPEEAFKALGPHTGLGLFLAIAAAVTVFVISISYMQVIELFPNGGGGYRVATSLLGRRVGLVSGSALVVDYVLTIAISIAAGVDALFSFLPHEWLWLKIEVESFVILVLVVLNLRGVKETIRFLLPIFLGFVFTHGFLILYGILGQSARLDDLIPESMADVSTMSSEMGVLFVIALFLRAYAMSGGTYTGIEAVSNSVNLLAEPRGRTGKWTMFYMALSLSFMAGGIILLYLLWQVHPVEGQTLNAVVFGAILDSWRFGPWNIGHAFLVFALIMEAGLLFVAANTGFLGGPAVLANMAADDWVPRRFMQLSDRLVTKNGIVLMGISALAILWWTAGKVDILVVLYSINVFLTFALTLTGLCVHWWHCRKTRRSWLLRLALAAWGVVITVSILLVLLVEKFHEGAWVSVVVTGAVIGVCALVYRHYRKIQNRLAELDEILTNLPAPTRQNPPPLKKNAPTAILFVSSYRGVGIHSLLNVQRMFPGYFQNFIFLSVGVVDNSQMKGDQSMDQFKQGVDEQLQKYVSFCQTHGLAAKAVVGYGTDPVQTSVDLAEQTLTEFPNAMFFAGTLVFREENWMTRLLHNHTAFAIQRQLHLKGIQLVIMPMLVDSRSDTGTTRGGST
jgi:amino acid transporter